MSDTDKRGAAWQLHAHDVHLQSAVASTVVTTRREQPGVVRNELCNILLHIAVLFWWLGQCCVGPKLGQASTGQAFPPRVELLVLLVCSTKCSFTRGLCSSMHAGSHGPAYGASAGPPAWSLGT